MGTDELREAYEAFEKRPVDGLFDALVARMGQYQASMKPYMTRCCERCGGCLYNIENIYCQECVKLFK